VRFKAGILLLIFVFLMGVGGCSKPGDEKQEPPQPAISAVQMSEETPVAEKVAQITKADKPSTAGGDEAKVYVDKNQTVSTNTKDAAALSPTSEAEANKQATQAKISITGTGIKTTQEVTLDELKQMNNIIVSDKYFSRGAEKPGWGKTAHNDFAGILLYELLADKAGLADTASQVKIEAEDGYTQVFSLNEIKANYIDETDSSKKLRMIIAWSQDGEEYNSDKGAPFRLVMGQQFAGDYNRLKWVNRIASIIVE